MGTNKDFANLHTLTEYMVGKSTARIKDLVQRAVDLGQRYLAITDSSIAGWREFSRIADQKGIRPVFGLSVRIYRNPDEGAPTDDDAEDKSHYRLSELVLLAKSAKGVENLIAITSETAAEGFGCASHPISWEFVRQHLDGLTVLSGGPQGEIQQLLRNGDYSEARNAAEFFADAIGRSSFYIELVEGTAFDDDEALLDRRVIVELEQLADELDILDVASNQVFFVSPDDAFGFWCISVAYVDGIPVDPEQVRDIFNDVTDRSSYLPSTQEMEQRFSHNEDAVANAEAIAKACFDGVGYLQDRESHLPISHRSPWITRKGLLEREVYRGLLKRYDECLPESAWSRAKAELELISDCGLSDYFIVFADLVAWARIKRIHVKPGFSPATFSIVAYALGITNIDPIDADIDFEAHFDSMRQLRHFGIEVAPRWIPQIRDYLEATYGKERVARMRYPLRADSDLAAYLTSDYLGLDRYVEVDGENTAEEPAVPDRALLDHATVEMHRLLTGAVVAKDEPGEFVVGAAPLAGILPVTRDVNTGERFVELGAFAPLGLGVEVIRVDAQPGLDVLEAVLDEIRRTKGVVPDLESLDLNNYLVLRTLGARGIPSASDEGRDWLDGCPSETGFAGFSDAVVVEATSDWVDPRHPWWKRREYEALEVAIGPDLSASIADILAESGGYLVYMEQLVKIIRLSGMSAPKANEFRRAINRNWREDPELNAWMETFKERLRAQGQSWGSAEALASFVWTNGRRLKAKAYAVPETMYAFQMAYLKTYYPGEYATVMSMLETLEPLRDIFE